MGGVRTHFIAWVGNTRYSHAFPVAYAAFVKGLFTSNSDFSGCVAAQILGLGGIDSTNSALNIEPGPRICAVVGGAGGTGVSQVRTCRFMEKQEIDQVLLLHYSNLL